MSWKARWALPPALVAVALLPIYLTTLAPGLTWANDGADGGDLVTAAATLGVAHPTGYPLYRLEWQGLGSLQRRLRGCMTGVRAEPWPYGAPELVALELYLAARAGGMRMETPAVRP